MNIRKKAKRKCTSPFLCAAVAMAAVLSGCTGSENRSGGVSENSSLTGQNWQSASYTLDEINAKFHPTFFEDERVFKTDDISDDAVRAYNVMLGYAERILGQEYYVYDYYYADWSDPPYSWVIKVVPYEIARAAEAEGREHLYIDEPLFMSCKEDGSKVASDIEPYYMERKWFADLEHDMAENFPDYQLELNITEFEALYPNVLEEKFPDIEDYTYIINDSFYQKRDEWEYGNVISVIPPSDTEQSEAAEIFEQIKPLLTRYCVTEVNLFTLDEYEYIDWEEKFTI